MVGLLKLKHADGTEATAQEAYDAFRNTYVLIVSGTATYGATCMVWYDNNSAQDNPTNVGYVKLSYVNTVEGTPIISAAEAGNPALVPTQQG